MLPSSRPSVNAKPELVVASALNPSASRTRADPASQGFGITKGSPVCRARKASPSSCCVLMAASVARCEDADGVSNRADPPDADRSERSWTRIRPLHRGDGDVVAARRLLAGGERVRRPPRPGHTARVPGSPGRLDPGARVRWEGASVGRGHRLGAAQPRPDGLAAALRQGLYPIYVRGWPPTLERFRAAAVTGGA